MSCLLEEKMQLKLIHDDSVYVCKQGMLTSLVWSVHKLDSFLRFTNDDHCGKFNNRTFCSNRGFLLSIFFRALKWF